MIQIKFTLMKRYLFTKNYDIIDLSKKTNKQKPI